jgi:hypothetical protein
MFVSSELRKKAARQAKSDWFTTTTKIRTQKLSAHQVSGIRVCAARQQQTHALSVAVFSGTGQDRVPILR